MKKFNAFEKAAIRNVAKTIYPLTKKMEKINLQIAKLEVEKRNLQSSIDSWESNILSLTGIYTSQDLIEVSFKESMGADGKVIKAAQFNFKYPETILPPCETGVEEEITTTNEMQEIDNQCL